MQQITSIEEKKVTSDLVNIFTAHRFDYSTKQGREMARAIRTLILSNMPDTDIKRARFRILDPTLNTEGADCPVCTQRVQYYRRSIYNKMARCLIVLYHLNRRDTSQYHHINDITKGVTDSSGDFAKFLYWGLIEQKPKDDSDKKKKTSGFWRITEKGKRFVRGEVRVWKQAIVFNSKCYGFVTKDDQADSLTIQQALGADFNYSELMQVA